MSDRPRLLYLQKKAYLSDHAYLPPALFFGAKRQPHQRCPGADEHPERRFSSYTVLLEQLRSAFDVEFTRRVVSDSEYDDLAEAYRPLYMSVEQFERRGYDVVVSEGSSSQYQPLPAQTARSFSASGGTLFFLLTAALSTRKINRRFNRYLQETGCPTLTDQKEKTPRSRVNAEEDGDDLSWLVGVGPDPGGGGLSTLHTIRTSQLYALRLPAIVRAALENVDSLVAEHSLDVSGGTPLLYGSPGVTSTVTRSDYLSGTTPHRLGAFQSVGEGVTVLLTGHIASDLNNNDFGHDGPRFVSDLISRVSKAVEQGETRSATTTQESIGTLRDHLATIDWTSLYKKSWLMPAETDRLHHSVRGDLRDAVPALSDITCAILRRIGREQQGPSNEDGLTLTDEQVLKLGAIGLGHQYSKAMMSNALGLIERRDEIQSGDLSDANQLVLGVEMVGLLDGIAGGQHEKTGRGTAGTAAEA